LKVTRQNILQRREVCWLTAKNAMTIPSVFHRQRAIHIHEKIEKRQNELKHPLGFRIGNRNKEPHEIAAARTRFAMTQKAHRAKTKRKAVRPLSVELAPWGHLQLPTEAWARMVAAQTNSWPIAGPETAVTPEVGTAPAKRALINKRNPATMNLQRLSRQ
jgi:hypothetical protein